MYDTHTCSYHCKRLKCIEAQRDELRDKMDKLIAEAIAAEREECAKIADNNLMDTTALTSLPEKSRAAWKIAAAIRARGEK